MNSEMKINKINSIYEECVKDEEVVRKILLTEKDQCYENVNKCFLDVWDKKDEDMIKETKLCI